MRYMMNGGYRNQPLVRLTLGCTLVFLVFLWISNFLLYFRHMSLAPASVVQYYLGSEAEFAAPRTYGSMIEVAHAHFAMMAMVLLLLTHLAIFVPWPMRVRVALVLGTFGAALFEELAGWMVRFVSPGFAPLKVASFLGMQACLAVLLAGLGMHLMRRPPIAPDP